MTKAAIEDFYSGDQTFPPSAEFQARALVIDNSLHEAAAADFEGFWAEQARSMLTWNTPFTNILSWDLPYAKWFEDGSLNVSYNCVDRHVEAGNGDKVAFHFVGEPGDTRTITYADLHADVQKFANVLKSLGIAHGDRVNIYMPMIPEAVVAMLACARIGAVHSVVFGGFSAEALSDRINDASAKLLITADGGWRRGAVVPLKANADAALATAPTVESVVVVQRTNNDVSWTDGRDHWWHDLMLGADPICEPTPVNSEDLLYLLYTSGTTGKPKGIMHSSAGYLVQSAFTHKYVFDLDTEKDVYWCTADIGWVTGHTYVVYGPLANCTTSVLYEGAPDSPDKDRWWSIVEQYDVNVLYTAPTAVRACMKWGTEYPARHDLSSLRVLGSVGEPINPEAWTWYREHIGSASCPVVDTWWQTETGSHMIAPLPGHTVLKPGSASRPLPGISVQIVNDDGEPLPEGGGYVTIDRPWPSMMRGIWNDPQRYVETYWSRFPGRYFAGDGAKVDGDGDFWFLGRVDDVMNVSGHRVSTAEVESALVAHPSVAEAAVIGATDALSGQAIVAYVVLRDGETQSPEHGEALRTFVKTKIGAIARPKTVIFVPDVPKTRSGKIMRRLLRDVAEGRALGDTTTLADPGVVAEIESRKSGSQED
jgi:acetyl-CoA synthetase